MGCVMPRKPRVLLAGFAEHVIPRGCLPCEQSHQATFTGEGGSEDDMKTAMKMVSALMLLG